MKERQNAVISLWCEVSGVGSLFFFIGLSLGGFSGPSSDMSSISLWDCCSTMWSIGDPRWQWWCIWLFQPHFRGNEQIPGWNSHERFCFLLYLCFSLEIVVLSVIFTVCFHIEEDHQLRRKCWHPSMIWWSTVLPIFQPFQRIITEGNYTKKEKKRKRN